MRERFVFVVDKLSEKRSFVQRCATLFLVTIFAASTFAPTASAIIADTQLDNKAKQDSKVKPFEQETTTKEKSFSYPQGMKSTTSDQPAARDAEAPSGSSSLFEKDKNAGRITGEALRNI